MTKDEYYKLSRDQKVPLRCPCLNNCVRYRDTAYFVGQTCYKSRAQDSESAMREMGILAHDEDIRKMLSAGEPTTFIGGGSSFLITNGCPEFFLHPHEHKLVGMKNVGVHQYSYDEYYSGEKYRPGESKHYTECAEYALFSARTTKKQSNRKPIPPKIKAQLQKEINSECPVCSDDEVGHFEIHHIDEDCTNNTMSNLLMVCRKCHSKFTKGDLSVEQAKEIKVRLGIGKKNLECVSVNIDSSRCSWERLESCAFYEKTNGKSRYPLLQFSLINNSNKTVLFTSIELRARYLPLGISGIPLPYKLKSVAQYKILLPKKDETTKLEPIDEIVVAAGQAFKFTTQLYMHLEGKDYPPEGRIILYFTFLFNNSIRVSAPVIFLNCMNDDPTFTLSLVS